MKILVLNCGSSSIKYALYNMDDKSVMTSGGAERVGLDGAFVKVKLANGEKKQIMHDIPEHTEGVKFIFSLLTDPEIGVIKSLDEIDAVGHRMVHGGEKFNKSVILTDEVLKAFEECSDLAPLHNPANLKGVNAVKELMPGLPQVGVFDTAFHQTMPPKAFMYAIPYELYEKYGIRRYGFHGTSHRYVSQRACEFLGIPAEGTKMVTCHVGNGGSIAAVVDGKCIDTSMGLTPLEGLVMGTRAGDIDGGAVTFIEKKLGLDADGMSNLLNKKSGVAGLTGGSSDMRAAILVPVWLRRCISTASRSISVPMRLLWVDSMLSYSRPVLVRIRLACVLRSVRTWNSSASSSTRRRTRCVVRKPSSLPMIPRSKSSSSLPTRN